jgi:protein-disulfide isomerase
MKTLRLAFFATLLVMFSQPVTAAEFKAKKPTTYKASDFAEIELNLSSLTDKQKDQVLKILNDYNCVCGCSKGTWANCIKTDIHCPYSRPMGAAIAKMIEIGKKEANAIRFLETYKKGVQSKQGKRKKPEDPNKIYPVTTMNAPLKGSPDAPVTIIEYTDYQCPFCKRVQPTLKSLFKEFPDKIRFASMNNPLSFHKKALPAAMAARAAGKQGKFWEMHELLFENSRALDDANLVKYAQKIGLDIEKFNADRKSEELKAEILKEQQQAVKNGATGTPAFFINGKKLSGARPLAQFKTAVEDALKTKKSTK